jgi:hypothetical protein
MSTWEKCSNAFLTKFFPLGKTNALCLEQDHYLAISQGCHISCDKFSSHTGNLNLRLWRETVLLTDLKCDVLDGSCLIFYFPPFFHHLHI